MLIPRLARKHLLPTLYRQGINQHKQHAIPLRAIIPPLMQRPPLNTNIALFHRHSLPRVHDQLHLALDHHAIVQTLRAMHRRRRARPPVHHAQHRAVGQREGHRRDRLLGGGIARDVDGESAARPHYVVAAGVAGDLGPVALVGYLDDALTSGVVSGDVAPWLAFGAWVGHDVV